MITLSRKFFLRRNLIIFVPLALLSLNILGILYLSKSSPSQPSYAKYTQGESPRTFTHISRNLRQITERLGIEDTMDLIKYGFRTEQLTMFECHTLAHMLGHSSRATIDESIAIAKKSGLSFCEGGFKHGLEAEIALQGVRFQKPYKQTLHAFCEKLAQAVTSQRELDCYHGAGHEFMRETMDVTQALTLCEDLIIDKLITINNCYKGVFSELTNLVGGYDGETGEILAGGPPMEISEHPIEFCASLDKKYQVSCGLELSGNLNNKIAPISEVEGILMQCIHQSYQEELQGVCLQSLSAVSAQHLLPLHDTLIPPPKILALPKKLRQRYLIGTGSEMREFIINGQQKDWEIFCASFPEEDHQLCNNIFSI